ncbi:hypothetical protein MASR2M15_20280 [Anaerolineales bacterium]
MDAIKDFLKIAVIVIASFSCGVVFSQPIQEFITNLLMNPVGSVISVYEGETAKQQIQSFYQITLPASSSNHYFANSGTNVSWTRFSIRPQDLSGLFSRSPIVPCSFGLTDGAEPNFQFSQWGTQAVNWWTIQNVNTKVGGQCSANGITFAIMADTSNPTNWTVYVEYLR